MSLIAAFDILRSIVVVFAAAAGLAADPAVDASFAEAETITVETWNVRYDEPADGPNAWPRRRDGVIDHLRRGEVGVIALQEVLPGQLESIRSALPGYEVFARSRERDPTRGEAVPILWRRDRWRLDEANAAHFWLSETPDVPGSMSWDTACTRMVTVVRLVPVGTAEGPTPRRPIWVCNVHLDHRSGEARLKGARLLRRRLATMTAAHPKEPVVVMGDFNASPDSPPVAALCGSETPGGFVDAWAAVVARRPEAPRGTWNGWRLDARSRRIDLVLVRGLTVVSADILRPVDGARPLSDHWPVRVTLASPVEAAIEDD